MNNPDPTQLPENGQSQGDTEGEHSQTNAVAQTSEAQGGIQEQAGARLSDFSAQEVQMEAHLRHIQQRLHTSREEYETTVEALRKSEEKYRSLFESIDEGFCIIQVLFAEDGRPIDYRFLETNPTFAHQSGLYDAVGKRMRDLEPRHEEHWFQMYGRIAVTGRPERFIAEAKFLADRSFDVYAFRLGRPEEHRVAVLFRDISEQVRAEAALQHMNEQLEQRVEQGIEQVRSLVTQLTMSEQAERRRISEILHDDLQQRLYGAQFHLTLLRNELNDEHQTQALARVDAIEEILTTVVTITRSLSVDLSPPVLHHEGLTEAVRWLATQMQEQHGLTVHVAATKDVPVPNDDLRVLLFHLLRELLFNVVKHAGVAEATVSLSRTDNHIRLDVTDAGMGFDVEAVVSDLHRSNGLLQIRRRLELVGGQLQIESAPNAGTRVVVECPVVDEAG